MFLDQYWAWPSGNRRNLGPSIALSLQFPLHLGPPRAKRGRGWTFSCSEASLWTQPRGGSRGVQELGTEGRCLRKWGMWRSAGSPRPGRGVGKEENNEGTQHIGVGKAHPSSGLPSPPFGHVAPLAWAACSSWNLACPWHFSDESGDGSCPC